MKDQDKKYRVNEQGMIVEEADEFDTDDLDEKEYPHYTGEHMLSQNALVVT